MKILVISNMYPSAKAPNYGTFVKNFCNQLDKLNVKYRKVVLTKGSTKILSYFSYYLKIGFNVLFNKYDIVYIHYASHNALPILFLNKIKHIKVYTNVHGGDVIPQTNFQHRMQRYTKKLLNISKKVIVPSIYFKKIMEEDYNIPKDKIYIYPSAGINRKIFHPFSNQEKKEISIRGISNEFQYIGFIGRLEKGKGWRTFLNAIYTLKKNDKLNEKKALIIGNGKDYNDFIKVVNELDLSNDIIHIKYLPQDKLANVYNLLSVFCFPTETKESLGLVALEALACGVPVIASNYAAPNYYIKDGINGFKSERGDFQDLANKIESFFDLKKERILMLRKNAYETGSSYYSDRVLKDLELIME